MPKNFDEKSETNPEANLSGNVDNITEKDVLNFTVGLEQVSDFLSDGPILDEAVKKVPPSDFSRLQKEYPTLFSQEVYQDPTQFEVYAVTFIRGRNDAPGHAKMKLYVDMIALRVLKVFATK
ncbi:MAG TPA: hypothetical protein VKK79_06560 [Candidatus Lokiarchaeia archaeon]|nr:hypothetical protein [Candidatus Lokiarchaeia archaeon]